MITIKEIVAQAKTDNVPILGTVANLSKFSFLSDYISYFSKFDKIFGKLKGKYHPTDQSDETAESALLTFQDDITDLIEMYKGNLERLYKAYTVEYEPIENSDVNETFTDATVSNTDLTPGKTKDENIYGDTFTKDIIDARVNIDENEYGETLLTTTSGKGKTTDEIGATNSTTTAGARTDSTERDNYGYNDTTSKAEYIDTNSVGQQVTTNVENLKTNTSTVDEKTDTENNRTHNDILKHTEGGGTDQHQIQSHTDTMNHSEDVTNTNSTNTLTHTLHRHGNIGVTTSQQMLQSEIDLWSKYNFYNYLYDFICENLCNYYEEDY